MKSTGIKRLKKTIVYVLAAALALPMILTGGTPPLGRVKAETSASRYFYNQLTAQERPFYDAMEQMYTSGIFKTGTQDYDLTANNYVSQADLQQYANGYPDLLNRMGAARDAFYFDHPDIFYVDFSALSLRVTTDSKGLTTHTLARAGGTTILRKALPVSPR